MSKGGRLKYPELLFSGPKKSGKTGFAAMLTIYTIVALGGRYAEAYCCANDFEQSQGRVFQAICRILRASPLLSEDVQITANRVVFTSTGSVIAAIPGAAPARIGYRQLLLSPTMLASPIRPP